MRISGSLTHVGHGAASDFWSNTHPLPAGSGQVLSYPHVYLSHCSEPLTVGVAAGYPSYDSPSRSRLHVHIRPSPRANIYIQQWHLKLCPTNPFQLTSSSFCVQ